MTVNVVKKDGKSWLLLDTCCKRGVIALWRHGQVLHEVSLLNHKRFGEELPVAVDACLQHAGIGSTDLSGIGVGQGPGSFMGVRIGLAHAKGMAYALGIGFVGIPLATALQADPSSTADVGPSALGLGRALDAFLKSNGQPALEAVHAIEPLYARKPDARVPAANAL